MDDSKNLISDEELLRCAKECRSTSAFNELLRRYTYYSKALSLKFLIDVKKTGISKEEIEQVALIAFYLAYKKIDPRSKAFYLYWEKVAQREIKKYYSENSYLEAGAQFAGISFDEERYDNNDHFLISDVISDDNDQISHDLMIEDLKYALRSRANKLTDQEKRFLYYYLKNYPIAKIAKKMNIPLSTAYGCYYNATKKLRLFILK